jgi:hypothetical protein
MFEFVIWKWIHVFRIYPSRVGDKEISRVGQLNISGLYITTTYVRYLTQRSRNNYNIDLVSGREQDEYIL